MGATLLQLANGTSNPTTTTLTPSNPIVEPLDGPSTVDQVFDAFCEEVYQQGTDSHLYRLLSALGGDSGAGFLKNQAYTARLQYEAEFLNFTLLNKIYSAQFQFSRLPNEVYPGINPATDALTPDDWDTVDKADQAYRQRVMEFWTAIRWGNSPNGLQTMAQAGIGVECELIESYKWIFDQMSDDPLGLTPVGTSASVSEFVIVPRLLNSSLASTYEYTQNYPVEYVVTDAVLPASRPALGGTAPSVSVQVGSTPQSALLPAYERNAIDLIDRLKPVGTLGSIELDDTRYIEIELADDDVHASSSRVNVNRLVTGQIGVDWPDIDRSFAHFINGGVETEAGSFYGAQRELPIIFLTIDAIHAYTEAATRDPNYLLADFFSGSVSTATSYISQKVGNYSATMQALYPFLNGLNSSINYVAENAVAAQETPLKLEGKMIAE